jgi:hypothetical protein
MSSTAPSIIMQGGFVEHAVYAEIFRLDNQYFALLHNLGAGSWIHPRGHGNKIIPLALYFKDKENLIEFSKIFCKEDTTQKDYCALVQRHTFETDPESALPFVRSLSSIDSSRTNPMHSVYREFRKLQREIISKLINPTGPPSEVKEAASAKRKEQKKGKATGGQ